MAKTSTRRKLSFKMGQYGREMSKLNRIAAASRNNRHTLNNNPHYQKTLIRARELRQSIAKHKGNPKNIVHFDGSNKSKKTAGLSQAWRQKDVAGNFFGKKSRQIPFRLELRQNRRKKKKAA